nr:interleukin-4 [Misgurnus anguillicaudatus]
MRTLLLLVLACIVVTDSKADKIKRLLLEETMETAKNLLKSKEILHHFVKNAFRPHSCSEQSICQVAKVLNELELSVLNNNKVLKILVRQLSSYAVYSEHSTCSVTASEECRMEQLLNNTISCCQKLYRKNLILSKKKM